MKNHSGCIKGYIRTSKTWYSKKYNELSVHFGMYHPDGGTSGEMEMKWEQLGDKLCARLECFEDSWHALSLFTDLIKRMGEVDSEYIQEPEFCKMLDECGFKDMTQYEDPYANREIPEEEMVSIKLPKGKAEKLGLI